MELKGPFTKLDALFGSPKNSAVARADQSCPSPRPRGTRVSVVVGTWEHHRASPVAQTVKNPPVMRVTCVRSLGWDDALEEGTATHSSILAMENLMHRGAWRATVHGVAKSWTQLSITLRGWLLEDKGAQPVRGTTQGGSGGDEDPAFLPRLPLDSSLAKPKWSFVTCVYERGQGVGEHRGWGAEWVWKGKWAVSGQPCTPSIT